MQVHWYVQLYSSKSPNNLSVNTKKWHWTKTQEPIKTTLTNNTSVVTTGLYLHYFSLCIQISVTCSENLYVFFLLKFCVLVMMLLIKKILISIYSTEMNENFVQFIYSFNNYYYS